MTATVSALRADSATSRMLDAALALRPGRAGTRSAPGSLNEAIALYQRGLWPAAYSALCRLADQGDAAAAKLALLMLRYDAALYGTRFNARPEQIARWAGRVIEATPTVQRTGTRVTSRATSRAMASPSSITAIA